ncbi:MAG: Ni/Fe-hydrogenase, b-type cytochrome subunit, partial [Frankiaceae bacterium]
AGRADSASHGQPGQPELATVKVWQLPTRLIHWGMAISILVLSVTGFYVGNPQWFPLGTVTMTGVKAVHYATGLTLIALLIARVIWMFSGNRYERFDQFVPFRRSRRDLVGPSLKYYGFLRREPPPVVGHNPLAGLTYLLLISMLVVESITGLALKSLETGRGSLLWTFFHWVFAITSISTVRFVHHLIMWLTLGFVIHHVYSAILVDHEERSGLVSSMVTGYKTVPKERL